MTSPRSSPPSTHAFRQIRKDFFISVLAVISVGIGLCDMARPRTDNRFHALDMLDLFIVLVFIVDFAISARASGDWREYAKKHWYEIPALIPVTGSMVKGAEGISMIRGLRLVRLVRILRLLRVAGTAARLHAFWKKAIRVARRAKLDWLFLLAACVILLSSGLVWLFEAPVNEKFSGGDSIWWALNMFTNVAYVDFHPMTTAGRVIAGFLEFSGIGFIGLFTASLASALLTDKGHEETEKKAPLD